MSVSQGIKVGNFQRPANLIEIASRNKNNGGATNQTGKTSFKEMFSQELASERKISISKHAHERMFSRGIEINPARLNQIADAMDKAQNKNSRETLILADDAAYVVSIKNRTIVTVFDKNNLREGVVTSIDSAVIL